MLTKLKISQNQVWGIENRIYTEVRTQTIKQVYEETIWTVFYALQNPIAFFGLWEEISHVVYGEILEG